MTRQRQHQRRLHHHGRRESSTRDDSANGAPPRSRAEQGEQTRRRIIDSAAQLFARYGYEGVSQSRVAEAAGITKPLLYHHFDSKQSLYGEVRAHYREMYQEAVGVLLEERGDDPDTLLTSLHARFRFYQRHPEMARMALWGFLEGSPLEPPSTSELRKTAHVMIERAKHDGIIRDIFSPDLLRTMLSALIFGWFAMKGSYMGHGESALDDRYFEQMLEMVVRGIGTPKLASLLDRFKGEQIQKDDTQ